MEETKTLEQLTGRVQELEKANQALKSALMSYSNDVANLIIQRELAALERARLETRIADLVTKNEALSAQ
jgi:cell shape-determining protein MreC